MADKPTLLTAAAAADLLKGLRGMAQLFGVAFDNDDPRVKAIEAIANGSVVCTPAAGDAAPVAWRYAKDAGMADYPWHDFKNDPPKISPTLDRLEFAYAHPRSQPSAELAALEGELADWESIDAEKLLSIATRAIALAKRGTDGDKG